VEHVLGRGMVGRIRKGLRVGENQQRVARRGQGQDPVFLAAECGFTVPRALPVPPPSEFPPAESDARMWSSSGMDTRLMIDSSPAFFCGRPVQSSVKMTSAVLPM
jgi:hypothetical protein